MLIASFYLLIIDETCAETYMIVAYWTDGGDSLTYYYYNI